MRLSMTDMRAMNLPPADDFMETGDLGFCSAVIVMWGMAGGRYAHVRGWHGYGGVGAIDFGELFAGVAIAADTHIFLVLGSSYKTDHGGALRELKTFEEELPIAYRVCQKTCIAPTIRMRFYRTGTHEAYK